MGNTETSVTDPTLPESLQSPVLGREIDENNLVILEDGSIVGRRLSNGSDRKNTSDNFFVLNF